jgi:anti-sigma factor (TIGR02949 family)
MIRWLNRLLGRSDDATMDCHQVGEVLQFYLDGEIDEERARKIEAHLEDCRRCGLEVATYEHIKATLAARRSEVAPESLDRLRTFGERLARGEDPTVEPTD